MCNSGTVSAIINQLLSYFRTTKESVNTKKTKRQVSLWSGISMVRYMVRYGQVYIRSMVYIYGIYGIWYMVYDIWYMVYGIWQEMYRKSVLRKPSET